MEGQFEAVKALIERGAKLECQDEEGFTPLLMAIWKQRDEIVTYLLQNNASMDTLDKNKRTCVHLAVLRKNENVLSKLVAAGASVNSVTGKLLLWFIEITIDWCAIHA